MSRTVATFEGSLINFPGASGWYTHSLGVVDQTDITPPRGGHNASAQNYGAPFANSSGVMYNDITTDFVLINSGVIIAQAVQGVTITENTVAETLAVIGHTGHAGFGNRPGTVDVTIESVLTSGLPLNKSLTDYEGDFAGFLTADTTDGATASALGKRAVVSGLALNSLTFTFTQSANSTMSAGFVADGVNYFDLASPVGMDTDVEHIPLTWEKITIGSPDNAALTVLSGVQTATFAATMTRNLVYEIGTFLPFAKPSQRPHTVNVTLNTLANEVKLDQWLNKFKTDFDSSTPANLITVAVKAQGELGSFHRVKGQPIDWITASGLRPATMTMGVNVGNNSTVDLSFTGTSLKF